MNKEILYYRPRVIQELAGRPYPGLESLSYFFKLYDAGSVPIDRTNTITTPVRTRSLFPLPQLRVFKRTFEEICNDRARDIVTRAAANDCDIYVMYSGGIDSTLVLVSLLRAATSEEKKRIIVIMSERSIEENPRFYQEYIRGKLKVGTRSSIQAVLGSKNIFVTGEPNDQLFGSDMMVGFIRKNGEGFIHAPLDRSCIEAHYAASTGNKKIAAQYMQLFERLKSAAPVPIVTNFEFLWWINFTLKWQAVCMRMLTFTTPRNAAKITKEYVQEFIAPFYNTEDFQLWSLNNLDKRIKGDWKSYKWVCKDIIYDYTKDKDYRDHKTKQGSLGSFMHAHEAYKFLDADFHLQTHFVPEEYMNPKNDFISS